MDNKPARLENLVTDKGKVPVYATGIVEQPWDDYNASDHDVWRQLYQRQREILLGRACDEFLQAQDAMGMTERQIPKFAELNKVLESATGWTLIGVEGLLPELDFFDHLANRRFPVTWWIRRPDQVDYIEEPDLFHDLFGHVPLLMNPLFADYMAAYEIAVSRCSTEHAPWHIIPADRNWARNAAIARIVRETLEEMNPQYPLPKDWDPKAVKIV